MHNEHNLTQNRGQYVKVSNEKRKSLIRLVMEEGESITNAANLLEIKYAAARQIVHKYEQIGIIDNKPKGGSTRTVATNEILSKIEDIVSCNPEFTLREIKSALKQVL